MDYNPFRSGGATQETVLNETDGQPVPRDKAGKLIPKAGHDIKLHPRGYIYRKKTNKPVTVGSGRGMSGRDHGPGMTSVREGAIKYVIPEEVPATERTAFHGAAAAAHKAGKSHFSFAGKKHPVTMKKDTANAIADQNEDMGEFSGDVKLMGDKKLKHHATTGEKNKKFSHNKIKKEYERRKGASARRTALFGKDTTPSGKAGPSYESVEKEGYYKDMEIKKQDKAMGAKPVPSKKKKEAKGGGKEGDVEMNPKMEKDSKSTPVEAKESKIRSALRSVLSEKSRDDHYKSSTDPEMMKDKIKGKGAEDMMKGADDEIAKGPDAHLDEPAMVNKDAAKMTSNVPKGKARGNDNMKGDTKIKPGGTPIKDPAAMKAESFGSQVSNMAAAYAAMQPIEIDELDESMLGMRGSEKLNGGKSLDPRHKSAAHHIDYHHRRSDGHMKSGGDEDQHRYQVAKKLGYKV